MNFATASSASRGDKGRNHPVKRGGFFIAVVLQLTPPDAPLEIGG